MTEPPSFCHWFFHPTERCSLANLLFAACVGAVSIGLAFFLLAVAPESMLWEYIITPQLTGNVGMSCVQARMRSRLSVPHFHKLITIFAVLLLSGSMAAFLRITSPVPRHFTGQVAMSVSLALACAMALGISLAIVRDVVLVNFLIVSRRFWRIWQRHYHRPKQVHCVSLAEETPGMCSICLMDLAAEEDGFGLLRLTCKHTFHEPCINSWLNTHSSCPVCRQDIGNLRACTLLYQGRPSKRGQEKAWESPMPSTPSTAASTPSSATSSQQEQGGDLSLQRRSWITCLKQWFAKQRLTGRGSSSSRRVVPVPIP